jgi:hypothetical protein
MRDIYFISLMSWRLHRSYTVFGQIIQKEEFSDEHIKFPKIWNTFEIEELIDYKLCKIPDKKYHHSKQMHSCPQNCQRKSKRKIMIKIIHMSKSCHIKILKTLNNLIKISTWTQKSFNPNTPKILMQDPWISNFQTTKNLKHLKLTIFFTVIVRDKNR